jgi:hypothetical protein
MVREIGSSVLHGSGRSSAECPLRRGNARPLSGEDLAATLVGSTY